MILKTGSICAAIISMVGALITGGPAIAEIPPLPSAVHHPNGSQLGAIAAEDEIAARVGSEILAQGGNAVDASVATAFALAVTFPRAGNIGGGGFMMIHMSETGKTTALDYREKAPARASREMFLDADGNVDRDLISASHKAAGVPGTVAGLLYAQEKYGTLSRKQVMAPAIKLAKNGFALSYFAAAMLETDKERLQKNIHTKREFYKPDGSSYQPGEVLKRRDLARTLKAISKAGRDGFYKGPVAAAIANDMAENGGLVSLEDLAAYEPVERSPIWGTYRGYDIAGMPPPSSGGIQIVQMLNMIESRGAFTDTSDSANYLHWLAEIMRRSFADRATHYGDSDFVDVPIKEMISKPYALHRLKDYDEAGASSSSQIAAGNPLAFESPDTTHISVIDRDGNMVSNTFTLNYSYGSAIVVPGTGILLNNEMDDFAAAIGVPNYYGLIGNEKNAIDPHKRPLSSMSPTLIFKDGEPFLATGAPGGSRIISAVLQVILNVIDRGMNIGDATDHPRIHHQWLPDTIMTEPGISLDTQTILQERGHTLTPLDWYARPQSVHYDNDWFYAYTDGRIPGGGACTPDGGCN